MSSEQYFTTIESQVNTAYETATQAREQGYDPETHVDVPTATDLAEKSVRLISSYLFPELDNTGVVERIRELEDEYGKNDERIGLVIGREIAQNTFYAFEEQETAIEAGIRIGLSYMTIGIVTAPLEGIHTVKIKNNPDGSQYLAIYYAGPIRSAGGTAQAVSPILADYIRLGVGLDRYKPTETELNRYTTEVEDYFTRITKKQYTPTRQETEMIASNVPVEITGTPTEKLEVSNYKDVDRIETNVIRGGMCLIYLDGLPLKAPKLRKKIHKYGEEFGLDHWKWIEEYIELQASIHATEGKKEEKYKPSTAFMDDIVGGRPVFSHPGAFGGFRPRYGRARTGGDAAVAFHPATMEVTKGFMAIGTQLRLEYPGKATSPTASDAAHPPIVKLDTGDVITIHSREDAQSYLPHITDIIFIGDILIPVGEFVKNGKRLVPSPYVQEWWALDLHAQLEERPEYKDQYERYREETPSADTALTIAKELNIPLHPQYTYTWNYITQEDLMLLKQTVEQLGTQWPYSERMKHILERLWTEHQVENGHIHINHDFYTIASTLLHHITEDQLPNEQTNTEHITAAAGITVKEKAPLFIGARMGRPEKARRRTLKGKPQILFPCGKHEGGRLRNLIESYTKGTVTETLTLNYCSPCDTITPFRHCPLCNAMAEAMYKCSQCDTYTRQEKHCGQPTAHSTEIQYNFTQPFANALHNLNESCPELLKAPKSVMGKHAMVEPLEKGILRQKYDLYVNKDGTIRCDSSNLPLTHFKPKEINTSIEKLHELGYTQDIHGNALTHADQVLQLEPQDIIISHNEKDSTLDYLYNVAQFIDDLLEKFYNLPRFYNVTQTEDVLGHLVIGLAPHTSAGMVGRIIGYTSCKATFAHPYWHASKRRDCDGDEDSIVLLLDALLNFSRQFLPQHTGGRTMDAPLIISSKLNPLEVDDEAWTIEVDPGYSRAFYEQTQDFPQPGDTDVQVLEDAIEEGYPYRCHYTHETDDIMNAPKETFYIRMKDMSDKVSHQLDIARKIRAVNENEVAELILEKHFLGDLKGNLSKFGRQTFRCGKCNERYRRVPLQGNCIKCNSQLLFTVHEGSIKKYLEPSEQIAQDFEISPYMRQQIHLLKYRLQNMFGKDEKQSSLGSFTEAR